MRWGWAIVHNDNGSVIVLYKVAQQFTWGGLRLLSKVGIEDKRRIERLLGDTLIKQSLHQPGLSHAGKTDKTHHAFWIDQHLTDSPDPPQRPGGHLVVTASREFCFFVKQVFGIKRLAGSGPVGIRAPAANGLADLLLTQAMIPG